MNREQKTEGGSKSLAEELGLSALKKRARTSVDFKLVSFTLDGKRYGIDIMKVKEIRKAGNFTYVPNVESFVRGVDNLRGDIIPIIDMRLMFSLPVPKLAPGSLENVIVLRFGDLILGIVVDFVEKVVGTMRENIRPPHPLLGDINIKYLSGIIEENGHLYVILNVDEIFLAKEQASEVLNKIEKEEKPVEESVEPLLSDTVQAPITDVPTIELEEVQVAALANWDKKEENLFDSISSKQESDEATSRIVDLVMSLDNSVGEKEKLVATQLEKEKNFHLSPLNTHWFLSQKDLLSQENPSTEEIMKNFYSPYSGFLWSDEYFRELVEILKDYSNEDLLKSVLVAGCGEGHEAYVIACAIRKAYGDIRYKIWALDNNLTYVMNTQALAYRVEEVPSSYLEFMLNTSNGLQFDSQLKENVLFEFSDVTQMNTERTYGLILACDLLSFLSSEDQVNVLKSFFSQLDEDGLLIVGYNEEVDSLLENWTAFACDKFKIYKKQKN